MVRLQIIIATTGMLLLAPAIALEQQLSDSPIENVLRNSRQAGTMCPAEDGAGRAPAGKPKPNTGKADLGCAISAAEAHVMLNQPDPVVADTRPTSEVSAYRINGAMSISAQELQHKSFLQKKPLILVGNGKGERELYSACAELKKAGFSSVKVLHGGMAAWLAAQKPVIGDPVAVPTLLRITPAQLFSESKFDANLVVLDPQMSELNKLLPSAQLLNSDLRIEAIAKSIKHQLATRGKKSASQARISSVVFVRKQAFDDHEIERLSALLQPMPLLVYVGTAAAIQQYAKGLEAMWQVYARGPQQAKCHL